MDGFDRFVEGPCSISKVCLLLFRGRGLSGTSDANSVPESVLEQLLPMLDDAAKLSLCEIFSAQTVERNEAVLIQASKSLALLIGSSSRAPTLLLSDLLRSLAMATKFSEINARTRARASGIDVEMQSQCQWSQLLSVIADKIQQRRATHLELLQLRQDSLGPPLLLSLAFLQGGRVHTVRASLLRALVDGDLSNSSSDLSQFLDACLAESRHVSASPVATLGSKRKLRGDDSESELLTVHNCLIRAFEFWSTTYETGLLNALCRVIRDIASADTASGRAAIYCMSKELVRLDRNELRLSFYAYSVFALTLANTILSATFSSNNSSALAVNSNEIEAAKSTHKSKSNSTSKRSKSAASSEQQQQQAVSTCDQGRDEEMQTFKAEIRELLCWTVGRLSCCLAAPSSQEDAPSTSLVVTLLGQATASEDVDASSKGSALPAILIDSIAYLAHNDSQSENSSSSSSLVDLDVLPSSELFSLHCAAMKVLYPDHVSGMSAVAALASPRLLHACFGVLRGVERILQEVYAEASELASQCSSAATTTAAHLSALLLVQALKPVYYSYPRLVLRIVMEALACVISKEQRKSAQQGSRISLAPVLSFISNLAAFEAPIALSALLDACAPMEEMRVAGIGQVDGENSSHGRLQAAVFLSACRAGQQESVSHQSDAVKWLCEEISANAPRGMAMVYACTSLIGEVSPAAKEADDLIIDSDLVRVFQQTMTKVLSGLDPAGVSEVVFKALQFASSHVESFFLAQAAPLLPPPAGVSARKNVTAIAAADSTTLRITDALLEAVETHQFQVRQQWLTDGPAALMELFHTVFLAHGLTRAMPLPELTWLLTQVVNRLVCEGFIEGQEDLCRAASQCVSRKNYLEPLVMAHAGSSSGGSSARAAQSTLLILTPLESFLYPGLSDSSATSARTLGRVSLLQLDLMLSSALPGRGFLCSSLVCDDWTSLTLASIHVIRGCVHESACLDDVEEKSEPVEASFLAVLCDNRARIVTPALAHVMQYHLLHLLQSQPPRHGQLLDSFAYCVACVEIAAACLSQSLLMKFLSLVFDVPAFEACCRALAMVTPSQSCAHLHATIIHMIALLSRNRAVSTHPGLLSLISLGHLMLSLSTVPSAPLRSKLLSSLALISPQLAAAVRAKAESLQSQDAIRREGEGDFLLSCRDDAEAVQLFSQTTGADGESVSVVPRTSTSAANDLSGGFLSGLMFAGASTWEDARRAQAAVVLPSFFRLWSALLGKHSDGRVSESASQSARLLRQLESTAFARLDKVSTDVWSNGASCRRCDANPSLNRLMESVIVPWSTQHQGQQHAFSLDFLMQELLSNRCAAVACAQEPLSVALLAEQALACLCSLALSTAADGFCAALHAVAVTVSDDGGDSVRSQSNVLMICKVLKCLPRHPSSSLLSNDPGGPSTKAQQAVQDLSSLLAVWEAGPDASACPQWAWEFLVELFCDAVHLVASNLASKSTNSDNNDASTQHHHHLQLLQSLDGSFVASFQHCVQALSALSSLSSLSCASPASLRHGAFEKCVRWACCSSQLKQALGEAIVLQMQALAPALGSSAVRHIPTAGSIGGGLYSMTKTETTPLGSATTSPSRLSSPRTPGRSPGVRALGLAALVHSRVRQDGMDVTRSSHAHDDDRTAADGGLSLSRADVREFVATYLPREMTGALGRSEEEGLLTRRATSASAATSNATATEESDQMDCDDGFPSVSEFDAAEMARVTELPSTSSSSSSSAVMASAVADVPVASSALAPASLGEALPAAAEDEKVVNKGRGKGRAKGRGKGKASGGGKPESPATRPESAASPPEASASAASSSASAAEMEESETVVVAAEPAEDAQLAPIGGGAWSANEASDISKKFASW